MSVKKLLVLSAAGIATLGATAAAFAGGPDVPPPPPQSGVYIQARLGYSYENWSDTYAGLANVGGDDGGFTVGGDIGYQINRFWAIEFGGMYVVNGPTINTVDYNDWFLYLGPKITIPLDMWVDNLEFFMKAGVAYRQVDFGNNSYDFWRPTFAAGFQYIFGNNWIFDIQYQYVPGSNRFATLTPDAHQFTASIGYRFMM